MSQVKLGHFWCMLDGDREDAFTVEADLEWEVSQFTKAIQEQKKYLRGCDTSDIVLLKVRFQLTSVNTLITYLCSSMNLFQ